MPFYVRAIRGYVACMKGVTHSTCHEICYDSSDRGKMPKRAALETLLRQERHSHCSLRTTQWIFLMKQVGVSTPVV